VEAEPEPQVEEAEPEGQALSEAEEQAIRDRYGYTESEKRTKAERDEVAARILAKTAPRSELPFDIEEVWGQGRRDSSGALAASTARVLIDAWGVERFRRSAIHQAAIAAVSREERRQPVWRSRDLKRLLDGGAGQ
jgi:hypothetical protein